MASPLKSTSIPFSLPSDQDASGRTFGPEEIEALAQAIESGTLTSTKGTFVKKLEADFAKLLGVKHAFACSSGTAALHTAYAALDTEPGDEFITTSITDMGALTPILYQGGIPVFVDVNPNTYNVTARSIEDAISERTKAIIVTHLFGNPCEMKKIKAVADYHDIPVIEDCAQAFLATFDDQYVGTIGKIGCFSLQQGKHITTGEGGLIVTDDDDLARRMFLFINKAWGYGDANPDHYFLALNYRMTELQGAVAVAQLPKLSSVTSRRIESARALDRSLEGIAGLETPEVSERVLHTYWKYCLRVNENVIPGGVVALSKLLRERNIACAPRYIQKPAFECAVFKDQKTFGHSRFPFTLARLEAVDYSPEKFPGTYEALASVLVLPMNELYTEEHLDYLSTSIRESVSELKGDA